MNKRVAFIALIGFVALFGSALSAQAQGHSYSFGVHIGYGAVYHGPVGFSPYYQGYYPYAYQTHGYQRYYPPPVVVYHYAPYQYGAHRTYVPRYPSYHPVYGQYSPRRYHGR